MNHPSKAFQERPKDIYPGMTKGVWGAADQFEYGLSWVTSRRASLKLFSNRLECGDQKIPDPANKQATDPQTKQRFIPCDILKIQTTAESYEFGLDPSKFSGGDLPFDVDRQRGRLKYSAFSIGMRIVLVAVIIWFFYTEI